MSSGSASCSLRSVCGQGGSSRCKGAVCTAALSFSRFELTCLPAIVYFLSLTILAIPKQGGLSPLSLSLAESLARRGAQLIILCPDPASASAQELVDLLRVATGNTRIFLERATLSSLPSIRKFISEWREKAKRTGAMGEVLGDEHVAALVFCPEGPPTPEAPGARYLLYDGLLPTLEKSSATDEPRVVNVVSSFYALGSRALVPPSDSTKGKGRPANSIQDALSSLSGRRLQGALALVSAILFKEFQLRLDAAAPAASSPAKAVPSLQRSGQSRIATVSVSTGLTRTDVGRIVCPSWKNPFRVVLWLFLSPFIWLLYRSQSEAANQVEWAIITPARGLKDDSIKPGGFYREGKEIG
jgi:NAD(P)-dependent dehydrogenase (short-subunit alcohol dehydrogenase family)